MGCVDIVENEVGDRPHQRSNRPALRRGDLLHLAIGGKCCSNATEIGFLQERAQLGREHVLPGTVVERIGRLAARDAVERITDDAAIEQAKHRPPQTTRARLRGEFIRQANIKGKDYRVDWVYLKLNDPERETILCKDPFQANDERVEHLIRSF